LSIKLSKIKEDYAYVKLNDITRLDLVSANYNDKFIM